jgi:RNA polymerase subunit RPABC4/transcription elongation factor Spt4
MKSKIQHPPVTPFGDRCLEPTISICKICPATCPRHSSREFYAWRGTIYVMQDTASKIKQRIRINKTTGCHEWQKGLDGNGYGKMYVEGRTRAAHRVSYEVFTGPIPQGSMVLHSCDNRKCVNPQHLWLGNAADNMRDKAEKGRGVWDQGTDIWNSKIDNKTAKAIFESAVL